MEPVETRSENRSRKRRERSSDRFEVSENKVRVFRKGNDLVGSFVKKEFPGNGVFLGKVVNYNRGLYRIKYEDGDSEDLNYREICDILTTEEIDSVAKGKLEELILGDGLDRVEDSSIVSKLSSDDQFKGDADSSSDSCESVRVLASKSPQLLPLQLPKSSGNVGVPEESIAYLFSVYNFLRSFSYRLFLSPFGFDDFVGSVKCDKQNSLLDAVHVCLLRALRRHLEVLSSDGAELAVKCLRRLDWSLLDTLTWPVYLVEYLLVMGYAKGRDWTGFFNHVLDKEYYSLSVPMKLRILQVLCDDVVESAELRAEINMRESTDVETNSDFDASLPPENGPRRVHPRNSKTSACKDLESMENLIEHSESKSPCDQSSVGSKVTELDAPDVADDGNTDECRLCGMDGTLLCCDGCPSAYHSRCTGLTRALLPEGSWFCPECTVNKIGPTSSRIGMGLRGAEFFGIDPYERVFLGTCNYLLVLQASIDAEPISWYYSQNDVPNVLQVLCSSAQHAPLYSQICKGISQYWELSGDARFSHPTRTEPDRCPLDKKEDAVDSTLASSVHETHLPSNTVEENYASENKSDTKNDAICNMNSGNFSSGHADLTSQQLQGLENTKFHGQFGPESAISGSSHISPTDPSDLIHQSSGERSIGSEFATCGSGDVNNTGREDADSMVLPTKNVIPTISGCRRNEGNMIDDISYVGSLFEPQAYLNHYILGDVAASAAANLAILSSENSKISEAHVSSNPRKIISANISLQVKAFAGAPMHFIWLGSERKLQEMPREKCGWCISCKGPVTNRRGCLLNSAALNAMKGAARVIGGIRYIKNGEGQVSSIGAYILFMEESLRGLIVGPLLAVNYRRQWRKQVEQACTCQSLKFLLLELEENIRIIALSGAWVKPVDDWSVGFSTAQIGTHSVAPAQKRGPGTRRSKKQSSTPEITSNTSQITLDQMKVRWWRGGKLSKLVYQKGILPRSVVKKAARQGGSRRIFGINYAESSEIPRRSRRFAWRAAVEMSKNASHLALQVRYLDAHIRWGDLVHPEQVSQDGKGLDTDTSAFRNAVICDKRIVERKIRYALDFGNQKHRPSRVMKNIIEEVNQDGKEKLWISENHIPLYLIKEYEKVENVSFPSSKKASPCLSKLQRMQLKASRKDIFSYLMDKGEKLEKCYCASCQQDVLLRDAVKCKACEGYCHRGCMVPSTPDTKDKLEFTLACNKCYRIGFSSINDNCRKDLKVKFSLQEQDKIVLSTKSTKKGAYRYIPLFGNIEMHSEMKPKPPTSTPDSTQKAKPISYGLIFKKNKKMSSNDFCVRNVLHRGNADKDLSLTPLCNLCLEPYNSDLIYICCEICAKWFHADAVQLKEDQISDLEGFKCCKCRRKASPICPYTNPDSNKRHKKVSKKPGSMETNQYPPISQTMCKETELGELATQGLHAEREDWVIEEDDFVFSLENVVPVMEHAPEIKPECGTHGASYQSLQKLPVRRQHVKHEKDDGFPVNPYVVPVMEHARDIKPERDTHGASYQSLQKLPVRRQHVKHEKDDRFPVNPYVVPPNATEKALSPGAEWGLPIDGELVDYEGGNIEDIQFEPQTYFSLNELVEFDHGQLDGLFDAPMDTSENWHFSPSCNDVGTVFQTMSSNNSFEPDQVCTEKGFQESGVAIVDPVPCHMCKHSEPTPDLSCEVCSLQIHFQCSPWDCEQPTQDYRWRCGYCRDWR
ncbi:DDT domain-containing protein PTM-like [Tasmannia lanceolata]|uniref:DDT domain-containing protein PTM-like n=1 Tax=Tasmannia lanceolata TaxID=3420 RepID=UPI0040628A22